MPPNIDTSTVGECGDSDEFKNAQGSQCKLKLPNGWSFPSGYSNTVDALLRQYPFGSDTIMLTPDFQKHHCGYHWEVDRPDTCGGYLSETPIGNEVVNGNDDVGYYVTDSAGGDRLTTGRILIACDSGLKPPFSCSSRNGVWGWLRDDCAEAGAPSRLNSFIAGDPFTCLAHEGKLFPHATNKAMCEGEIAKLNDALEYVAKNIGSKIWTAGTQQKFPVLFCGLFLHMTGYL
jgi:hypothetical protein